MSRHEEGGGAAGAEGAPGGMPTGSDAVNDGGEAGEVAGSGGGAAPDSDFIPDFRIRPATLADLDRIVEVDAASFTRPWSAISFQSLMGADHVVFLVAEVVGRGGEAEVVGHGTLIRSVDEADLATIAVAPAMRGQGIGGALLDEFLEAARDAGLRHIFLEVRASNEPAISLYLSRGFRHVGVRRQYYDRPPEDALVLRYVVPSSFRG